jgi:hypothetical protein
VGVGLPPVSGKIDGSGVRKKQKVCCNKAEQSTAHGRVPLILEVSIEDVHEQMCGSGPTSSLASCVAIDGGLSIKGCFLKCCANQCSVQFEVKTSLLLRFPNCPAGFFVVQKLTVLVKRSQKFWIACSPLKLQPVDVSQRLATILLPDGLMIALSFIKDA